MPSVSNCIAHIVPVASSIRIWSTRHGDVVARDQITGTQVRAQQLAGEALGLDRLLGL